MSICIFNIRVCFVYLETLWHTYNQIDGKEDVDQRKQVRCLCHHPTITLDRPGMKPQFRNPLTPHHDNTTQLCSLKSLTSQRRMKNRLCKRQLWVWHWERPVARSLTDAWLKCADREEGEGGAQHLLLKDITVHLMSADSRGRRSGEYRPPGLNRTVTLSEINYDRNLIQSRFEDVQNAQFPLNKLL